MHLPLACAIAASGHNRMVGGFMVGLGALGSLGGVGPRNLLRTEPGDIRAEIREDGTLTIVVSGLGRVWAREVRGPGPPGRSTGNLAIRWMETNAHWTSGDGDLWLCNPRAQIDGSLTASMDAPRMNWRDEFRLVSTTHGGIFAEFVSGNGPGASFSPARIADAPSDAPPNPRMMRYSYTCSGNSLVFEGGPREVSALTGRLRGLETVVWERIP
jgi:hypothetical protein